jgi:hypothetical protein
VVAEAQVARQFALRVVVAADPQHLRADLTQARHLRREEQAGGVVAPLPVVEVPREQQHARVLVQAQLHQVLERAPGGSAHLGHGGALVAGKAAQGAVQVQIGRVDEREAHGCEA